MRFASYISAAAIVLSIRPSACPAQDVSFPFYVGRRVCLTCHVDGGDGRPCSLEDIPDHDRSYEALDTPEAAEIALLCGLGEGPRQSRICLGCHATAADEGPRWTEESFDIKHGVQCEACHGAGSRHVEACRAVIHQVGPREDSRPSGWEGPRRNSRPSGWVGPGGHIRRVDRSSCKECHVERTSHEEVLKLGFRRRPADRRYKTPVNLAISPDGRVLYVVCEHSDSVVVADSAAGRVIAEISVGRRPHDAAVSPDGRKLYVTNRLADSLTVIDVPARTVTAEIPVGHEPHGVLTDASGRWVYVLNTGDDSISVIDVNEMKESKRLAAGRGPWSLALRPDGASVLVTNVRPNLGRYRDPSRSEATIVETREAVVADRVVVGGANMMQGVAFVPGRDVAMFTLMRTKNLVPMTRLAQGWVITNGLGVISWGGPVGSPAHQGTGHRAETGGRVDQLLLDEPNASFPDPIDVAVSPDGRFALVSSGGSDQVAVIDVDELLRAVAGRTDDQRRQVLPNHLGTSGEFVVKRIPVANNPRGIVYSPDGRFAYVANALADSVTVIETAGYTTAGTIGLGGPEEITEIRRGERLFHSAKRTFGRQFSCRSCHPDGHHNGLGFDIEADGIGFSPVDNRSLRGILDTPPFKWEGTNPTLGFQCGPRLAVFFTRLAPFTPAELAALVRYECTIERPPNPHRRPDGLTPAQRRGKAVFERVLDNRGQPIPPDSRCITCHNSSYKTSRRKMAVGTTMWFDTPVDVEIGAVYDPKEFGESGSFYFADVGAEPKVLDVPHLVNVYDGAPYLHNGAAATLEEIWTRYNMVDGHGLASDLTRRQFNDLIAYLKAL